MLNTVPVQGALLQTEALDKTQADVSGAPMVLNNGHFEYVTLHIGHGQTLVARVDATVMFSSAWKCCSRSRCS